jgi:hypothetical protein
MIFLMLWTIMHYSFVEVIYRNIQRYKPEGYIVSGHQHEDLKSNTFFIIQIKFVLQN